MPLFLFRYISPLLWKSARNAKERAQSFDARYSNPAVCATNHTNISSDRRGVSPARASSGQRVAGMCFFNGQSAKALTVTSDTTLANLIAPGQIVMCWPECYTGTCSALKTPLVKPALQFSYFWTDWTGQLVILAPRQESRSVDFMANESQTPMYTLDSEDSVWALNLN